MSSRMRVLKTELVNSVPWSETRRVGHPHVMTQPVKKALATVSADFSGMGILERNRFVAEYQLMV